MVADSPLGGDLWVYLERSPQNELLPVSLELLGKGRELADELNRLNRGTEEHAPCQVAAVILGQEGLEPMARAAIEGGADKVYLARHELLTDYTTEGYTKVVDKLLKAHSPSSFLIGATYNGRDLAGRLAVRTHTGLTADVVRLEVDPENQLLLWGVPGFGGSIIAMIICPEHRPQMGTVRPGLFAPLEPDTTRTGQLIEVAVKLSKTDLPVKLKERHLRETIDITSADRVVAAGVGAMGQFQQITQLAETLEAAVGATRPLADEGLVDRSQQIGSTGVSVKPDLLICAGISGAAHLTAGIKDAGTVVAINLDPEAAIFDYADYCLVGDVEELLPLLMEKLTVGGGK